MKFIEFYKNSTGYIPGSIPPRFDPAYVELIPALGSDGVKQVRANVSEQAVREIAEKECRTHRFKGWRVFKGRSFSDSWPISPLIRYYDKNLEDSTPVQAMYGY